MRPPIWGRSLLCCLMLSALGGCSLLFDKATDERVVAGERLPLRQATSERTLGDAEAPLPPQRDVRAWPQAGGAAHRTVGNIKGQLILDRVWSRSIGSSADSSSLITTPPVADETRIFALDAAGQVTARTLDTGDFLWETELVPEDEGDRDGFGGGLAVSGDTVIAATGFGEVIALNVQTGERLWTYSGTAPIRAAPAVSGDLAIVVGRDGRVIAISVASGVEVWQVTGVNAAAGMSTPAAVAISGEVVAAPFGGGEIGIFRLRDGRRGWVETLGAPRRGSALSLISDVTSPPVMAEGRIFAGGVSGRVAAFDIPTGRRIWGRDLGVYNPVWVAGDVVYLVTEDARVMALGANNGQTIWETQLPRFEDPDFRRDPYAYGGPIMVGDALFLTSTAELLHRVNATTGRYEGEVDIPGPSSIPPIAVNGRLYVLDNDGDLHAYE